MNGSQAKRNMVTQEPGKILAKSFSSLCGIQINMCISRVNPNASYVCHSVACPWQRWDRQPSPPMAHRQACSSPCIPTWTIRTCSPFDIGELDKKVLPNLNYSPVRISKLGLSGHLGGISQPQHRACPADFESRWAICDCSSRGITPSLQGRNTSGVRRLLSSSNQLASLLSTPTWVERK